MDPNALLFLIIGTTCGFCLGFVTCLGIVLVTDYIAARRRDKEVEDAQADN